MTIQMRKKVKITVLRTEYYQELAEQYAIPNLGMDDTVYRFDCDGRPMVELPQDSPVRSALRGIVEKLGL